VNDLLLDYLAQNNICSAAEAQQLVAMAPI